MLSSVSDKIVKTSDGHRNDEALGGAEYKENKKLTVEPFVTKLLQDPTVLLNNEIEEDSRFETYASEFSLAEESDEINELLRDGSDVKTIYSEYVPSKITHKQFWVRYFFLESELRLSRHRVGEIQMREEDLTWGHDADDYVGWDEDDVNNINSDGVKIGDIVQTNSLSSKDNLKNSDSTSETKVEELKVQIQRLHMDLEDANKVIATLRKENTTLKAEITSLSGSGFDSSIIEAKNEPFEVNDNDKKHDAYEANVSANESEKEGKEIEEEVSFPDDTGARKVSGNSSEDNGSWEEDFPEWE